MFGTIKFEYDLSKDKKFSDQVEKEVSDLVTRLLYRNGKNDEIVKLVTDSIVAYFRWKNTTIEEFVKKTIIEMIAKSLDDKSTLSASEKAESFITHVTRDAVKDIIKEKLKDVKITGIG